MKNENKRFEIGSEYWLEDNNKTIIKYRKDLKFDSKFLMSGRTAIDFVLQDIMKNKKVKKAYFPSYCCDSMLQPFYDNNIEIEFYEVNFNEKFEYTINLNKECDIFYAMSYFGFEETRMDYYIEKFAKNCIVIEDITHSLLSQKVYNDNSDYIIASLRKWFPIITGGIAIKKDGTFNIDNKNFEINEIVYKNKKEAMRNKYKYIMNDENVQKQEFLDQYARSNKELSNNYKDYNMDHESKEILNKLDLDLIRKLRKENAMTIIKYLETNNNIKLMCKIKEGDCPLFIPIIVKKGYRDSLKKYLIDNNIYCPVHWNKPQNVQNSDIYETELSLICDQRYSEKEIKKYIKILNCFFKEK